MKTRGGSSSKKGSLLLHSPRGRVIHSESSKAPTDFFGSGNDWHIMTRQESPHKSPTHWPYHTHTHHHHHQHTDHTTHITNTLTIPCTSTHCPESPGTDACGTGAVFWAGNSLMEPQVRNFRWNGWQEREKKKNDLSLVAWGNRRALTGQRTENTTVSQGLINGDSLQSSTGSPAEHSWSGPQNSTGSPAEHSWPQQFNGLVLSLVCSWGPSRCDQSWPSCWQKDTLA